MRLPDQLLWLKTKWMVGRRKEDNSGEDHLCYGDLVSSCSTIIVVVVAMVTNNESHKEDSHNKSTIKSSMEEENIKPSR